MEQLIVKGGKKLSGEIVVQGAKNACLPIMGAAMIPKGESVIKRCPGLEDTNTACEILNFLGCRTKMGSKQVSIDSRGINGCEIPKFLMNRMRSSIVFLGAMLARTKEATVHFPGGCDIGSRPIDLHISALRKMGVDIEEVGGKLHCKVSGRNMHGAEIFLSFPSVGATENVLLAAATADGVTIIRNASAEPETEDLVRFLNKCGAKIKGGGTSTIYIEGVKELYPCEYTVIPDRIVTATLTCAVLATGGEILIKGVNLAHISSILPILEESGCFIRAKGSELFCKAPFRLKAFDPIRTMPYPGFPTDAQPVMMALAAKARGTSIFVETIFENRFKHVSQLQKFGASIRIEDRVAVVEGVDSLQGAVVNATDLRGGAALVIAAVSAEGTSQINEVYYIDRGYEHIEKQMGELGANIIRNSAIANGE